MTVSELIKKLQELPMDKIVIISPDGDMWDNIGDVIEENGEVKITMSDHRPFSDD